MKQTNIQSFFIKNNQINQLSIKHFYTVKLTTFTKNYSELDLFREHIEWHKHSLPQTFINLTKRKVIAYKLIFLGLALLFFALAFFVCMKTFALPLTYFLQSSFSIAKNLVCLFCTIASFTSLYIFSTLNTDQEIINHLTRKTYRDLWKFYSRKKIEGGIRSFFDFRPNCQKTLLLNQIYQEASDKIYDLQEEIPHLFQIITQASHINQRQKELLYNQVILEMNDKLQNILFQFKQSHL
jgi:hypothetical protein